MTRIVSAQKTEFKVEKQGRKKSTKERTQRNHLKLFPCEEFPQLIGYEFATDGG